jgi:hypothetical protein
MNFSVFAEVAPSGSSANRESGIFEDRHAHAAARTPTPGTGVNVREPQGVGSPPFIGDESFGWDNTITIDVKSV